MAELPALPPPPVLPANTATFQAWTVSAFQTIAAQNLVINSNVEAIAGVANPAIAERIAVAVEGLLVEARRPFTGGAA